MTATVTTKQIKDAAGNIFLQRVLDASGTGEGPFLPLTGLADPDGDGPVDIAALVDGLVTAIAAGALVLPTGAATDAQLSAILAKLVSAPALDASLGGTAAAVAGDTGASTTNGFLRHLRDKLVAGIALGAGSAVIGKIGQQVGGSDVAATNPVPVGNAQVTTATATIASGTSLSGAADLGTGRIVGLVIPASWTSAAITFQGSADGSTYFDLYDDAIERTIASGSVAASRFLALSLGDWLGIRAVKLRSGTAASPVNQPADRVITLVTAR